MFYYVYILQSIENNALYIGYTSDLKKRFKEHNLGLSKATKPYIPYKLIFYEAFLNRIDAKNREEYLKGGYGRKTIKAMIGKYLNNTSNQKKNAQILHCKISCVPGRAFMKKHFEIDKMKRSSL